MQRKEEKRSQDFPDEVNSYETPPLGAATGSLTTSPTMTSGTGTLTSYSHDDTYLTSCRLRNPTKPDPPPCSDAMPCIELTRRILSISPTKDRSISAGKVGEDKDTEEGVARGGRSAEQQFLVRLVLCAAVTLLCETFLHVLLN